MKLIIFLSLVLLAPIIIPLLIPMGGEKNE